MSLNKVMLIGRLGKDPEVRNLDGNATLARFPIATSEYYKDKNTGERVEKTEWHNITCWQKLGEVAGKYLKKGSQVYIEGKLQTRSWEDQNGEKKYATDIRALDMRMLDSKGDGGSQSSGSGYQQSQQNAPSSSNVNEGSSSQGEDFGDDLPF